MLIDRIDHPIAQDTWHYQLQDGRVASSQLIVGQPSKVKDDPNGDWICPVWNENITPKITIAYGVGPVDALMNAMALARSFFDKYKDSFTGIGQSKKQDQHARQDVRENRASHSPACSVL